MRGPLIFPGFFLFRYACRQYARSMFKHIVVPIDGSACSLNALEVAARFAREQQARLTICTVVDPARAAAMSFGEATMAAACLDALDDEATAMLERACEHAKTICSADVAFLEGPTVETIVEYVKSTAADLIVIGSHGRSGLPRLFIGSVAEGVIRNANVPVMVVRQVPVTQRATATVQAAAQPA